MGARYFARSKFAFLPPGPWVEISEGNYEKLKKLCKVKDKTNFDTNGAEATVVADKFPHHIYEHIEPQLYELLERNSSE